jgi:uncharacterized zinc-type alcohol dehydrogenase-like protein
MASNSTFHGFAALSPKADLVPFSYTPRPLGAHDVEVRITHSGICASDLHQVDNGWGHSKFPMVPGHEIIGFVSALGPEVKTFKTGERVGVGTFVHCCRTCQTCRQEEEQMCDRRVYTYNDQYPDGSAAYGGYADYIRVEDHYVFPIPAALSSAGAAPLLCAGITTYTPFRTWKVQGKKVGIVGVGGLGHLAVKWAVAFGNQVTAISHSSNKAEEAKKLGAQHHLSTADEEAMKAAAGSFDFLLITAAGPDYTPLLNLLTIHGVACNVSAPEVNIQFNCMSLVLQSRILAGSVTGGLAGTQEMLEFAAKHHIEADVQTFPLARVNEALRGVREGKPRFRYVLLARDEKSTLA